MMDPDEVARRAAASLHDRAADVAATEDALASVLAGGQHTATRLGPPRSRKPWVLTAGVAVAVIAMIVGVVALRSNKDEPNARITDVTPSTGSVAVETTATTAETHDTTGSTIDTVAATTIVPEASSVPPTATPVQATPLALTNGVTVNVPESTVVTRSLDRLQPDRPRADTITDLTFADRSIVRIVLTDVEPDWPGRVAAEVGGTDGWTASLNAADSCRECSTLYGSVVDGVARRVDDDTWLLVESTPGEASLNVPDQLPVAPAALLTAIADTATYLGEIDRRVASREFFDDAAFLPFCTYESSSVNGAPGAPDLALFTCDGALAIYDGETGERTTVVEQFDAPGAPVDPNTEGSGSSYVDGIAVTPDGSVVYYSVGPEPVSGTTYSFDVAKDAAPEPGFGGWAPTVDPTGRYLVVSVLDMVIINDLVDGTSRTIPMEGAQVGGSFAFSPDGATLAVEMFGGTIALVDLASYNVTLIASDNPQMAYRQPFYSELGLHVIASCCTGGADDQASTLVLDSAGVVVGGSADFEALPFEYVHGPGGETLTLRGTNLEFEGKVIATGVLEAAVVPAA